MADDSEDEDLAALRNAVLASMKTKPKPPPPKLESDDGDDIAALRAAALRTKKATTVEPANSHGYPTQTPIMPVESISGVGHNSPYHEQQLPSSPHRQNFHPQQPPGSPHRHPPPSLRPGFVPRHGFPRGRGGFGPRNQCQFGPRNQSQFNVRPAASNLIVLTTAPEPKQKESDNRNAPHSAPSATSAVVAPLMVRPQDKWASSGGAALEPPKPEKPKGPARFSRLESDSDSDSDESDMEFGISSSKDSPSSSSSSSEDEQENHKEDGGGDNENGSPKHKDSVIEKPTNSPDPPEPMAIDTKSCPSLSKSKEVISDGSYKETESYSPSKTSPTKPDYTRVPPPALSPAPSPKRNSTPPAPIRRPITSRLGTKPRSPETSNRDQQLKQLISQDTQSNNSSASAVNSNKSVRNVDTKTPQDRNTPTTKSDDKDQAVLDARRRKFESIPSKLEQGVPRTILLHSGGHKQKDSKTSRKEPNTQEMLAKESRATDKKVNGRKKSVSPSRSSNSSSQSDKSDSDSSSSNTISPSDSDSDSDSGRRGKHKATERGKDDIDRERRQREAREREERRASRQAKGRETEAIGRSRRRPTDQSRLPRSYSKIQNDPERHRSSELPAQYRKEYPDKDRHQSKGNIQDLSRREKYRRQEPKEEQQRREQQRNDQSKDEQKYKSKRKEDPRQEQSQRDEAKHDRLRREERHVVKEKRDDSKNYDGKMEKIDRRDDQKHGRRVIEEPPRECSKREEASNRVSQDLRDKVGSKESFPSDRKTKRSRTPDTWSDSDLPESELQEFSEGESDLSELSDIDSPPQKLKSVTRIVKGQADHDHSLTSQRAKDRAHRSRDSRSQRSSERREPSADSSGSHKKTCETKSARIILDDHKRGKKNVDAREIICKLKGERAESPSSEKTEPVKHNPQISITFNKGTVSDEPSLEGKSSKSRLSVHERLGMPVKHKSNNDIDTPELSPELKVTRRVITEDPTDVRHRLKERQRDSDRKSDKDTKRGADRRENDSEGEEKPKKTDRDRKRHKKKDYNIWSSHRAVTLADSADTEDRPQHAEPTPHLSIEHRLGKVVKGRSLSPEAEVQDVRSRLTQKRKKRSIEERLGVQSVIATPSQPIAEQGPERKRVKQCKENTKRSESEGDLNEKIKRIQEQNEVIRRRKEEVDRDKQRYS